MHALIEKTIKKYRRSNPIYAPDQYACKIRGVKKTGNSYKVSKLCHSDIFDLKALAADLSVISPRNFKFTEIRVFKVTKDNPGTLYYKTSYAQTEFEEVCMINPRKSVDFGKVQLKKCFSKKPGISEAKKKGLLSLLKNKDQKDGVPLYYSDYYRNL
nr:unnamed protein product [Callosobruchus chinensis]